MPLSWNEIKSRAVAFSNEWKDTRREEADAKPFLIDFLKIFDISQKRVATFEHRVKKISDTDGYIDLLWPGTLLVEMKSRGQDLNKAYTQAKNYCHGLKDYELPKLIMISDFQHFHVYREDGLHVSFEINQLIDNLQIFEEIAGYQKRTYHEEDPVNIKAAELMGKLHDQLKDAGYTGNNLEVYLVRLLFILFADDTTIFQNGIFFDYLEQRTKEDGSDLAMHIDQLFQILDIPEDKRLKNIDDQLNIFPYVNGRLFTDRLPTAAFNTGMRQTLLDCCKLDWGKISPAIFGSLFQSVMNAQERRNLGAHYTSEKNILKVIRPLFMDDLWDEFNAAGENHNKLKALHSKISKLRFLDPACGCGNFLITAYRELRMIELAIVEKLLKDPTTGSTKLVMNINQYFLVDLDQFYGIELGEFASQIAGVAMFLIDHQMNMLVSDKFGEYIPLIPLQKSAIIVNENALRIDWQSVIKPLEGEIDEPIYHYILGNPPFVGKQYQNEAQKKDMELTFKGVNGAGVLDLVTAWYLKAAKYMQDYASKINSSNPKTITAFVSTNSISQGEQVSVLWGELFNKYKIKIHFAHRTFGWTNEAKGVAAVHCVIVGFSNYDIPAKKLYSYESLKSDAEIYIVKNITPFLTPGSDLLLDKRRNPICNVQEMVKGSMPNDGGYFLLDEEEVLALKENDKIAYKYIKKFIGGFEFLNNVNRYCLWLVNSLPVDIINSTELYQRVNNVRKLRLSSEREATRKGAATPTLFGEIRQPKTQYLALAEVSSERRNYLPVGFIPPDVIASNKIYTIADATFFSFGILSSTMHITWLKQVSGRLKSDYSYSTGIVYNNYPWPEAPTDKQKQAVEEAAQVVLDARAQFPDSSLADLYDPNTMPPVLVKAHQQLDKAVDLCYRPQPFTTEAKRIEYLFELYEKYTGGLFVPEKKSKKKKEIKAEA
jgi:hypothetical protein